MLWQTKVKLFKHFFRGIKNNWYKFMLSFAWLGALATGFACSLIIILKETALNGGANAGWWVLTIFIGILALLSALYMMVGQGMYVTYKFKMKRVYRQYLLSYASYDIACDYRYAVFLRRDGIEFCKHNRNVYTRHNGDDWFFRLLLFSALPFLNTLPTIL